MKKEEPPRQSPPLLSSYGSVKSPRSPSPGNGRGTHRGGRIGKGIASNGPVCAIELVRRPDRQFRGHFPTCCPVGVNGPAIAQAAGGWPLPRSEWGATAGRSKLFIFVHSCSKG